MAVTSPLSSTWRRGPSRSAASLATGKLGEDLALKLEAAETEQLGEHRGAVRFFPDGNSTGGRIVLAQGDRGYQVGVQWLTGRVLMASWQAE